MRKKVLIGGGSGLVGKRLTELLIDKGYEVAHLSRSAGDSDIKTIQWDVKNQELAPEKIEGYEYIINLTGAGIIDEEWSEERKQVIIDSRIKSTQLLAKTISKLTEKPSAYVSASAVGYYGFVTSDHIFKESDEAGTDFLAETCVLWEESVHEITELNIPTAKIRIGIVLAKEGGALKEMAKPIKYYVGAPLGSGEQFMPWIHIDDLCGIFIHAMENKLEGAYNAGSPNQHNNKEFTKVMAEVLNKPLWLPNVPAFIMKMILGERALLVLKGSRVSPEKIQKAGFKFKFTDLKESLQDIYA